MSEQDKNEDGQFNDEQRNIMYDALQKIIGKSILEVHTNHEKYLNFYLALPGEGDEPMSLSEVVAGTVAKLKAVELIVMTIMVDFFREHGGGKPPEGALRMMHYLSKDITGTLLLINEMVEPAALQEVYSADEISNMMRNYMDTKPEMDLEKPKNMHEVAESLKGLLEETRRIRKEGV